MERETITITTPKEQHKVVLKAYLIGREKRAIHAVFLKDVQIETGVQVGSQPSMKGIKGSVVEEAENVALEAIVVSIDESKENIVDRVLDMHAKDYQYIVGEINKITEDSDFEEKKTN